MNSPPNERDERWLQAIIGRLMVERVVNLSDTELERALMPCVCGPALVDAARRLRNAGKLTDDVINERKVERPTYSEVALEWERYADYLEAQMYKAASELQGVGHQSSLEFHRLGLDSAYAIIRGALNAVRS